MSLGTDVDAFDGVYLHQGPDYTIYTATFDSRYASGGGSDTVFHATVTVGPQAVSGPFGTAHISGPNSFVVDHVDSVTGAISKYTYHIVGTDQTGHNLVFESVDEQTPRGVFVLSDSGSDQAGGSPPSLGQIIEVSTDNPYIPPQFRCFVEGTLLLTERGYRAVEVLELGDRIRTSKGDDRPVRWIGHQRIQLPASGRSEASPVRVLRNSFAENVPMRDVWLSPGHAVCIDVVGEVLIPVGKLVNGATIARVEVAEVNYWHIGLDDHELLVASGLTAESYLDHGESNWSGESGAPSTLTAGERCRPFYEDGPIVVAVRERLADRARSLGWASSADMDMHLTVDGERIDGEVTAGKATFHIKAGAKDVRVVSKTFVPALWGIRGDERLLGLFIRRFHVADEKHCDHVIDMADPRLTDGFYAPEMQKGVPWRWTNGEARLPPDLWADAQSDVMLSIDWHATASRAWVAPYEADASAGVESNVVLLKAG
ncbi:Hint domain-containing protein [Sphingomonas sp. GC_Shp_3]|uniref:Hint domain-containing protein n=1 Tax=Sphingomonas sp. GC_Shp_3 TaxID=2937383 RepID=UPI00226A2EF4|nr:Hint domain-containing protein [Sphingomonas sp. GC_Shp_3]